MNKPSKFALALAFAAVTASGVASAQSYPNTVDNWRNPFGNVWKNGTNELCWRDAFWTRPPASPAATAFRLRNKRPSRPRKPPRSSSTLTRSSTSTSRR